MRVQDAAIVRSDTQCAELGARLRALPYAAESFRQLAGAAGAIQGGFTVKTMAQRVFRSASGLPSLDT